MREGKTGGGRKSTSPLPVPLFLSSFPFAALRFGTRSHQTAPSVGVCPGHGRRRACPCPRDGANPRVPTLRRACKRKKWVRCPHSGGGHGLCSRPGCPCGAAGRGLTPTSGPGARGKRSCAFNRPYPVAALGLLEGGALGGEFQSSVTERKQGQE